MWNIFQVRSYVRLKNKPYFNRTEILSSISSEHNGIKLEIDYMKKTGKSTSKWRLKKLLNNQQVKEEIKGEIKSIFRHENEILTY